MVFKTHARLHFSVGALAAVALCMQQGFAVKHTAAEALSQKIVVAPVPALTDEFMRGVDVSMVDAIEKAGGEFYNARGEKADVFEILKESGVNWIRIRLWNNPVYEEDQKDADGTVIAKKGERMGGGNNDLETDVRLAKRVKAAGLKFLLDFHYSDFWADPAKQYMPQDWKSLSPAELETALETFTKDAVNRFAAEGAAPDAVQIGNELNAGFLWPAGQIWSPDPNAEIGGMEAFMRLLSCASRGVRSAQGGGDIKIMIHLADGGKQDLYRYIFDNVVKAKIDYDIIGLSYYSYWHGPIEDLTANLQMVHKRYGKPMVVVETAYAFTEENGDEQGNVFQLYSDASHGYVPSVQGQATAVRDVIQAVAGVEGGIGVFYWEADSFITPGAHLSATEGNTWENQAMFSFDGKALPSLAVWGLVGGKNAVKANAWGGSAVNAAESSFVPYALSEAVEVQTKPGVAPSLPETVKLVFTDDSERLLPVQWKAHKWAREKKEGVVRITGKVPGYAFKPTATVTITKSEK